MNGFLLMLIHEMDDCPIGPIHATTSRFTGHPSQNSIATRPNRREAMTEFERAWWNEQQQKADQHRAAILRRERLFDCLSWCVFIAVTLATTAWAWWMWPL